MKQLISLSLALSCLLLLAPASAVSAQDDAAPGGDGPNIIYILADDLGYNELGCYGQEKIHTPHLDALAANGMRFTDHYSGHPVCAPSRCVLMTGLHTGHSYIRENSPWASGQNPHGEGQEPLPADTVTLARLLQQRGYTNACIGKWGLGGPETTGAPENQGFDHFFGYLCQKQAHDYYPAHVWRNGEKVELDNPGFLGRDRLSEPPDNYDRYSGNDYTPDLMLDEALGFIRENKDRPFFLWYTSPIPHVSLQVPDVWLEPYADLGWDDGPYLGQNGYLPHPTPRAAYAAMITHLDAEVGRIVALVKELGLEGETLIVFSSDNGASFNGGCDREFFESNAPLRGMKTQVWEGGIRVPMIASWPGHIAPGSVATVPSYFADVLPTCVELAGGEAPDGLDGVSLVPTLLGEGEQQQHDYLYWENGNSQAIRVGDWKAVRMNLRRNPDAPLQLYNLADDIAETNDLADAEPEVAARMRQMLIDARTPSAIFKHPTDP